jgi:radical SAM family uncharacterized protein/radical SAM-linked protein
VIRLFDHPYAAFLDEVSKPARYTGAEHGARRKNWTGVEARVCLAFPDVYEIGMSHLGYRILYDILNRDERTLAERCYTPWLDLGQELLRRGLPLMSLESARPLRDFDVVGFSLQYELAFTNVLMMLKLGGIALRSRDRADDAPLVVAGGPVATHVEPLAPFLDAVLVGDGEQAVVELALAWTQAGRQGLPRARRLERLARLAGVYVPSLYETQLDPDSGLQVVTASRAEDAPLPVRRRTLADFSEHPFPAQGPVGGPESVFDRLSIEIARGCTEGCRFCQAGVIYRPLRERSPRQVLETVASALAESGQDEVGLAALSTADVSYICPLLQRLANLTTAERVSLGVASLRAYGLPEALLDAIHAVRTTRLTFAPEAGTQRLRDVINKNITEEQLLQTAERVFARGFDRMKLYFILGLPTETDADVQGIVQIGRTALATAKRLHRRAKVTLSISTHVPKPHTPFQWCGMDPHEEIVRKQQLVKLAARGIRGLSVRLHDVHASRLEALLARGDRQLAPVVERAFSRGAKFDAWDDQLQPEKWAEALQHYNIDPGRYLGPLPRSARTPWDHLDVGVDREFLWREYAKALRGQPSPPCGKARGQLTHHIRAADARADQRELVCYDCGARCDLSGIREQRIAHLEQLDFDTAKPVTRAERTQPALRQDLPERRRPPQPGSPPVRWRIRFGKTGPAALLGHLDLIRELPRVVRRAGVRTAYTRGFHPKPDMSLSPALGLGIASLGEYVDIKLIDAPSPAELLDRMNRAAPGGLVFLAAAALRPSDPALSSVLTSAAYVIALDADALRGLGGRRWLEARLEQFRRAERVPVVRKGKRSDHEIDAKALVHELSVGAESAERVVHEAGLGGSMLLVCAWVALGTQGSVRPREIVAALTGDAAFPHRAVRAGLLAGTRTPLDLD